MKATRICAGCGSKCWQSPGVPEGTLCVKCQRDGLLSALKALAGLFKGVMDSRPDAIKAELWADYKNALAAIAKAEGRE